MQKILWVVGILFSVSLGFAQDAPDFERMLYRHPGLLDDLAVGLWCWPVPVDADRDGNLDLVISCDDTPYNGVYRFLRSSATSGGFGVAPYSSIPESNPYMPVFQPGERISEGQINVQASFLDGTTRVLRPAAEYPDFAQTGLKSPQMLSLPENVHPNGVRGNMWKYVDFNGDGRLDIAVGTDDWSRYGWANAWDEQGSWKNPPSDGNVYVLLNEGSTAEPKYAAPFLLKLGTGEVLWTYGWPCPNFVDFDGDGDLDLFCGEFRGRFTYFANVGNATKPVYASGVPVRLSDGSVAQDVMCMVTPVVLDWTGDGRPDMLCGNEDGRVSFYENTGGVREETVDDVVVKVPVFKAPRYFQQEAYELKAGSLATPCCVDWNGDGAVDIITGQSAGNILFFENLSPPGTEYPTWARPKYLEAAGEVIHLFAGPNGSIQGPIEERYGYTTLTVADWDGDGLLDILANSIWGRVVWFPNTGTKTEPKLAAAVPVEVEWDGAAPQLAWGWDKPAGKELLTQWRTTPVMVDWNEDGLMDLCMLDTEGYWVFFERFLDKDGTRKLRAPQRIFRTMKGEPLQLNAQTSGASGRRKVCVTDWDGDGKLDLLVNSRNVEFWRQERSADGQFFFQNKGNLGKRVLAGHTSCPTVADFNADGVPDLVVGAEDGRIYYLRNPRTKP